MRRLPCVLTLGVALAACGAPRTVPAPRAGETRERPWSGVLQLGGTATAGATIHDVAATPAGGLVIVACYVGDVELGGLVARGGRAGALLVAEYPAGGARPRWAVHTRARCGGETRLAVDREGRIFVAADGIGRLGPVDVEPGAAGAGPILVVLERDGATAWSAAVPVRAEAVATDGVGGAVVAGWSGDGLAMRPTVVAIRSGGTIGWSRSFHGDPYRAADLGDLAVHGDQVAIAGVFGKQLTSDGLAHAGPSWRNVFFARLALADGAVTAARSYGDDDADVAGDPHVAFAPDGHELVIAGGISGPTGARWGANFGWGNVLRGGGDKGTFLFALRVDVDDGAVRWVRTWERDHLVADVADLEVTDTAIALTVLLEPDDDPATIDFGAGPWRNAVGDDLVALTLAADSGATVHATRFEGGSELAGGRAAVTADGALWVAGAFTDRLQVREHPLRAHTAIEDSCPGGFGASRPRFDGSLFASPPPFDACAPRKVEMAAGFLARILP